MKVISWLSEREGLRESSGESVKVIGWLSERGESSGESVKVIGWLSEREGLRESSGEWSRKLRQRISTGLTSLR